MTDVTTDLRLDGRGAWVTGAAVFLASEASRFVTGTTLTVDGDWTAR